MTVDDCGFVPGLPAARDFREPGTGLVEFTLPYRFAMSMLELTDAAVAAHRFDITMGRLAMK